jgi:hypothetical protein
MARFTWSDGKKYEGHYEDDKRNGHGDIVSLSDGRIYEGQWRDNKMNGLAAYICMAMVQNTKGNIKTTK